MSIHGSSGKKEFLHCRFQLEGYQYENTVMKPNDRFFPIRYFFCKRKDVLLQRNRDMAI